MIRSSARKRGRRRVSCSTRGRTLAAIAIARTAVGSVAWVHRRFRGINLSAGLVPRRLDRRSQWGP